MKAATVGSTSFHRRPWALVLLLAFLASLLPLQGAAAQDPEPLDGDVHTLPHVIGPGRSPLIDVHVWASDGTPFFADTATVSVIAEDGVTVGTSPVDIGDHSRASFRPPPLDAGRYALSVESGGRVLRGRADFVVATPHDGAVIALEPQSHLIGERSLRVIARAAFLGEDTVVTSAVRSRWDADGRTREDVTATTTFVREDDGRGVITLPEPSRGGESVEVTLGDDRPITFSATAHLMHPGIVLDDDLLLTGSTAGQVLSIEARSFAFDGAETVRLRSRGIPIPTRPLGTPSVDGDRLTVEVLQQLGSGLYELEATTAHGVVTAYLHVAPAHARLATSATLLRTEMETWRRDHIRLEGTGQGWSETTTAQLLEIAGSGVAEARVTLRQRRSQRQDLYVGFDLTHVADGLHRLRIVTGDEVDDSIVIRVKGPHVRVREDGDRVIATAAGFLFERGASVILRDRDGRRVGDTVVTEASGERAVIDVGHELQDVVHTVEVAQASGHYTGRFRPEVAPGDRLEVRPAHAPAGADVFEVRERGGAFSDAVLGGIARHGAIVPRGRANVPEVIDREHARLRHPGGLPDGDYRIFLDDDGVSSYGLLRIGKGESGTPRLAEIWRESPPQPPGVLVATAVHFELDPASQVTAQLHTSDANPGPIDGVGRARVLDRERIEIEVSDPIPDGVYKLLVDINGAAFWATLYVGDLGKGPPTDRTPPVWAPGSALTVVDVTSDQVVLRWPAATDPSPPVSYQVHADGRPVTGWIESRASTVSRLAADTSYAFAVYARDAEGNITPAPLQGRVTTSKPSTLPPPSAPTPPTCSGVATASFPDVPASSVHAQTVGCAAGLGLVRGVSSGGFQPDGMLTRGQFATIVDRALAASNVHLIQQDARFTDIRGNAHEVAIRRLAAAGIILGVDQHTFNPQGIVTRGQMMTMLDRASRVALAPYPSVAGPRFEDARTGPHAGAIDRLSAAGIAQGLSGGARFGPNLEVDRAQAASFLVRWLEDQAARLG